MKSKHYKYWKSVFDLRRCIGCKKMHGQIFLAHSVNIEPPLLPIFNDMWYTLRRQGPNLSKRRKAFVRPGGAVL